jgi:hypothetical protein
MNETDRDNDYRLREIHASLDRRIESVEQRTRHRRGLTTLGSFAGLAALAVSLFGLNQVKSAYLIGDVAPALEAQALVLRDGEGIGRGVLKVEEGGSVTLALRDENAQARLQLSVLADGSPGVSLMDSNGDTRAILGFLPDGTTTLVFADAGAVARTVLALTPDGASRIVFSDGSGETRAAVGVDGDGHPEVNTMAVGGGS